MQLYPCVCGPIKRQRFLPSLSQGVKEKSTRVSGPVFLTREDGGKTLSVLVEHRRGRGAQQQDGSGRVRSAGGRPVTGAAPRLTVWDHHSTDHGSEHNREGEGFKPQGRHVASSGKGPVFLLYERK